MIGRKRWVAISLLPVLMGLWSTRAVSQDSLSAELETAANEARTAWLVHDAAALVATSDTVRLQLPGVGRAPAVHPGQAAMVLEEYFRAATEITFEMSQVRFASDEHAYVQFLRRYAVEGTEDERVETVFLGFRLLDGRWRLREVRVAS